MGLPAGTRPGAVDLRVRDVERVRDFWVERLGLTASAGDGGIVALAAGPGGEALIALHPDAEARPAPGGATGLFHLALVVPDRASLGRVLARLLAEKVPLQGASDHLVSEALYLADPEGNGIEIYADRPREDWTWSGGSLRMATLPLDLQSLLAEGRGEASGIPPGTRMGHVHLRVSDLDASERFYGPAGIGLDVTTREYPAARFLAAAGYHHHLGMNVWGVGGRPEPGSAGLVAWTLVIPQRGAAEAAVGRVGAKRVGDETWEVTDPDGIPVRIMTDDGYGVLEAN